MSYNPLNSAESKADEQALLAEYGFTLDETQNEDDMNFEHDGVRVLVDSMSWTYLQGSTIQYKESSYGSSFTIDNPKPVPPG